MRKLFTTTATIFFFIVCKHNSVNAQKVIPKGILIIKEACAVNYEANAKAMERQKKKMGEDFYTAADDHNFYLSQLNNFLNKKKLKVINTEKNMIKFVQPNGSIAVIDLSKELWATYFFKPGSKPKKIEVVSPESEYDQYFGK